MLWQIEIEDKPGVFDAVGAGLKKDIEDLKINSVEGIHFVWVYSFEGDILESQIQTICEELLVDKIVQAYRYFKEPANLPLVTKDLNIIEIAYNLGVMDPVEESCLKAIKDLGIESVQSVRTAKKYIIEGKLSRQELNTIIDKLLCNKIIQHVVKQTTDHRPNTTTRLSIQFN
ncbi:MAG: phosphoribosylformylglycinamidine synthase subunit PurS [Candidatus Omnitrophota bacterium]|nr:phosphoribosylformylglycinamidine synthase subunit PurS [Candidatus Omnitrophota bacterium]